MNCRKCESYNRGRGTKTCLKCEQYVEFQKKFTKRKTIRYEVVPDMLLESFPDETSTEDQRMLLDCIRALPTEQAVCIALKFYLEFPTDEIAETLQISKRTVTRNTRDGLRMLRVSIGRGK